MTVNIVTISWYVTQYSLGDTHQRCVGVCCFHLRSRSNSLSCPERSTFLRTGGAHVPRHKCASDVQKYYTNLVCIHCFYTVLSSRIHGFKHLTSFTFLHFTCLRIFIKLCVLCTSLYATSQLTHLFLNGS